MCVIRQGAEFILGRALPHTTSLAFIIIAIFCTSFGTEALTIPPSVAFCRAGRSVAAQGSPGALSALPLLGTILQYNLADSEHSNKCHWTKAAVPAPLKPAEVEVPEAFGAHWLFGKAS